MTQIPADPQHRGLAAPKRLSQWGVSKISAEASGPWDSRLGVGRVLSSLAGPVLFPDKVNKFVIIMGGKGGKCSLLENKQKQVAFCRGGGGRGCVWGQGRAGWERSLEEVTPSEGSQPGQGGGERCCVTLVGTVGWGSETVASACCHVLQQPQETHTWEARWACGLLCADVVAGRGLRALPPLRL